MAHDRRLFWAQGNRGRQDRVRHAAGAIESLVGEACRAAFRQSDVQQWIDAAADDEFRRHCRVSRIESATLFIRVDSPVLVSTMRRRWNEPLLRALRDAEKKGQGIRSMVFEYGND